MWWCSVACQIFNPNRKGADTYCGCIFYASTSQYKAKAKGSVLILVLPGPEHAVPVPWISRLMHGWIECIALVQGKCWKWKRKTTCFPFLSLLKGQFSWTHEKSDRVNLARSVCLSCLYRLYYPIDCASRKGRGDLELVISKQPLLMAKASSKHAFNCTNFLRIAA